MHAGWQITKASKKFGSHVEVVYDSQHQNCLVDIGGLAPLFAGQRIPFGGVEDIEDAERIATAFAIFLEQLADAGVKGGA